MQYATDQRYRIGMMGMPSLESRHLSWANFEREYLGSGQPMQIPVRGMPEAFLFCDAGQARIGLEIEAADDIELPVSPLLEIRLTTVERRNKRYLSVSTQEKSLFQSFYFLLLNICDAIQEGKRRPEIAVRECIDNFKSLLRQISTLTAEEQIGLWGELWLLERLIRVYPEEALACWTGRLSETHDFRIGNQEFEVKTTRNTSRIHIINGLGQLVPSPGKSLYVLSLQVEDAGAKSGLSLSGRVRSVCDLLSQHDLQIFQSILREQYRYKAEHEEFYRTPQQLRTLPALIPVDPAFPALTNERLASLLGPDGAIRITRVSYQINLDGVGFLDGTPEFEAVIPPSKVP